MDSLYTNLINKFSVWGISQSASTLSATLLMLTVLILICLVVYKILNRYVGPLIDKIARRTPTKWDDVLFRPKFLKCIWVLVSVLILSTNIDSALGLYPNITSIANKLMQVAILIVLTSMVIEFVRSLFMLFADHDDIDKIAEEIHRAEEDGTEFNYQPAHTLKGLQQMIILLIICIAVILLISLLFGKNPLLILSGLSAGAAVLMLVFQDSILGVVAGIQLTANKMVQPGDWITSEKYGVDGIVKEISLATVKVQNWDMTIVTMPPYSLINDGFQNWQGMFNTGGRRIKRSFTVDVDTIRFCTEQEKERWSQEPWAKKVNWAGDVPNVTLLRAYLDHLMLSTPELKDDLLHLIRELQPTPEGLPIEIYFFSSRTNFVEYEHLQANIIDYIFAKVPEFGLKIYQRPTSYSISQMSRNL